MAPANEFVVKNRKRILYFFEQLAAPMPQASTTQFIVPTGVVTQTQVAKGLKDLALHYYRRNQQTHESLKAMLSNSSIDAEAVQNVIDNIDSWAKNVRLPASELPNQSEGAESTSLTLIYDPSQEKR